MDSLMCSFGSSPTEINAVFSFRKDWLYKTDDLCYSLSGERPARSPDPHSRILCSALNAPRNRHRSLPALLQTEFRSPPLFHHVFQYFTGFWVLSHLGMTGPRITFFPGIPAKSARRFCVFASMISPDAAAITSYWSHLP